MQVKQIMADALETTSLMSTPPNVKRKYQKVKPITTKNIGKQQRHVYDSPKVDKQTGAAARRLRQQEKIQAKKAKRIQEALDAI